MKIWRWIARRVFGWPGIKEAPDNLIIAITTTVVFSVLWHLIPAGRIGCAIVALPQIVFNVRSYVRATSPTKVAR